MFYKAKNKKLTFDNKIIDYIEFGKGNKDLIIIPGVGDGFKTVKGLALPFAIMYRKFAKDYKVYVFSRAREIKKASSRTLLNSPQKIGDFSLIKKKKVFSIGASISASSSLRAGRSSVPPAQAS